MILLWFGLAYATEVNGTVETFGVGDPVDNATIRFHEQTSDAGGEPNPTNDRQVTSDQRGRFHIQDLMDAGTSYLITVTADGYEMWTGEWNGKPKLKSTYTTAKPLKIVVESLRAAPR